MNGATPESSPCSARAAVSPAPIILVAASGGRGLAEFEDRYLFERLTNPELDVTQRFEAAKELRSREALAADIQGDLFRLVEAAVTGVEIDWPAVVTGKLAAIALQSQLDRDPRLQGFVTSSLEAAWKPSEGAATLDRYTLAITLAQRSARADVVNAVAQFVTDVGIQVDAALLQLQDNGAAIILATQALLSQKLYALRALVPSTAPEAAAVLALLLVPDAQKAPLIPLSAEIALAAGQIGPALQEMQGSFYPGFAERLAAATLQCVAIHRPEGEALFDSLRQLFAAQSASIIPNPQREAAHVARTELIRGALLKRGSVVTRSAFLREVDASTVAELRKLAMAGRPEGLLVDSLG